MTTVASISAKADVASAPVRWTSASTSSCERDLVDGRQDPAELAVPALEVRRESIVAIGQPGQLVIADDRIGLRRSPLDTRSTAATTERSGASSSVANANAATIAKARRMASANRRTWANVASTDWSPRIDFEREDDDAEDRKRDDRREEECRGQPGAEAHARRSIGRRGRCVAGRPDQSVVSHRSASAARLTPADTRPRGPSRRGPDGSGRPRPSGGGDASSPTHRTDRRPRSRPIRARGASRS